MEPRGLNTQKISAWLEKTLGQNSSAALSSAALEQPFEPPYEFELIAAGGSNLTYRITDQNGASLALRRPPESARLASAHDMGREWRVMSALFESFESKVPVPECIAYETDPEILGADFYIMDFIEGIIWRDQESTLGVTADQAEKATKSLIQVQAEIHTLDLQAAGLSDLGKHQDYVGRQLRRWKRQVDAGGVRELPLHNELYERLLKFQPPETAQPSLVHGDYRFDNCILSTLSKGEGEEKEQKEQGREQEWEVAAVLDWELCTIGNPIADFVWSLQYWSDPEDDFTWLPDSPTLNPVFMSRQEYSDLYEEISGLNLADVPYYTIFSWWKQASIVEGVYARILAGAGGGSSSGDVRADEIAERVDKMLEYASEMANGIML